MWWALHSPLGVMTLQTCGTPQSKVPNFLTVDCSLQPILNRGQKLANLASTAVIEGIEVCIVRYFHRLLKLMTIGHFQN